MIRSIWWFVRVLFAPVSWVSVINSTGSERMRQRAVVLSMVAILIAMGMGAYSIYFNKPEDVIETLIVPDDKTVLPQDAEFEQLARNDPVGMLEKCLVHYQREVTGFRCLLDKEERIQGKLYPPEKISLSVRGDVPDPATGKTRSEVLMKWHSGAHKAGVFGIETEVKAVLYVEAANKSSMLTYRPDATFPRIEASITGDDARKASRYCIRDAGLYHVTLRTYDVWKQRKIEGRLATEYLGRKPVSEAGGVECFIVKRLCKTPEIDPFELGGSADMSPESIAREGFSELTVMIDAKRWLQVGTVARRANGDLIGSYYFKDVELNPEFASDTFTKDGLKK